MCCSQQRWTATFESGAVEASQTQFMSVQMSRQHLEEGGRPSEGNVTGAVKQNLKTNEVKETSPNRMPSASHATR